MLSDLFLPLSSIYSPPIFSLPSLTYLSPNTHPLPHSLHQSLSSPTFLASLISPHLPFHSPSTYNPSTYLLPHPPTYSTILHHYHIPLSSTFLLHTHLLNLTTSSYFLSPLHLFESPPCSHAPPYSHLSSLISFPYPLLFSHLTSPLFTPHPPLSPLATTSPLLSFSYPPPHFLPDLTSPTPSHLHLFILLRSLPLTPISVTSLLHPPHLHLSSLFSPSSEPTSLYLSTSYIP